ncbi:MAG: glycosyltransferase family 39 protein [Candidatus Omnitrophota bacterium]
MSRGGVPGEKIKEDRLSWIALLLLFAFHVINNMVIIFQDSTPFIADASDYYKISFFYWKGWMDFINSGDFYFLHSILRTGNGGQLAALLAIPFFSVFGVSHDVAILANQAFFLILLLSIFGLGKILWGRTTGLLAAFIISFYLGVVGFSRVYMLEFPILAISTACVYLLIKSEGFKNFKYSLCFGFVLAMGELLRPRFVVYIVVPVLFYVIKNIVILLRRTEVLASISVKKIAINILTSAVLSCLILLPWYPMDKISEYFRIQILWSTWPALSKIGPTLPHYLQMLWEVNLGWFFTFLFFLGLAISLFEKNKRPKIYFLLVWIALTLILVAMFGLKNFFRLEIPLLAPMALISAAGMEGLSKRKIGKYLVVAFLILGIFQYFFISYGNQFVDGKEERQRLEEISLSRGLLQAARHDWSLDELMSTFEERRNSNKEWDWRFINANRIYLMGGSFRPLTDDLIKVLNADLRGSLINNEMEERILIGGLPIVVMGLYTDQFNCNILFSDKELQHIVLGADYVMRYKAKWPEGSFIDKILDIFDANISRFEKLKIVETPRGEISIYGRKKEDASGGHPMTGATL